MALNTQYISACSLLLTFTMNLIQTLADVAIICGQKRLNRAIRKQQNTCNTVCKNTYIHIYIQLLLNTSSQTIYVERLPFAFIKVHNFLYTLSYFLRASGGGGEQTNYIFHMDYNVRVQWPLSCCLDQPTPFLGSRRVLNKLFMFAYLYRVG